MHKVLWPNCCNHYAILLGALKSLGKRGPGMYTVPGLMKLTVVRKPATKARKGINPFAGEETMYKAKAARNVIRIRPLRNLKNMV